MHCGEFRFKMGTTIRDLIAIRIAITAGIIARTTANQIRDENVAQTRAIDHPPEQIAGAISAEGNSGAVAAEASGSEADKRDLCRYCTVARHHTRAGANERVTTHASKHRCSQVFQWIRGRTFDTASVSHSSQCGVNAVAQSHINPPSTL
jgi:hypothetical protein